MSEMSHGPRSRSRQTLRKRVRERGLPPITRYFQVFDSGDKVAIKIDSSLHKGMPHHRFHGKVGTVVGKQGNAYLVKVVEGHKAKIVIANSEHLRKHGVKI